MATGDVVQSGTYDVTSGNGFVAVLSATPTAGNTLVFWVAMGQNIVDEPLGFTAITPVVTAAPNHQAHTARMWYRIVQSGDTASYAFDGSVPGISVARLAYVELEGTLTLDTFDIEEVEATNPNPNVCGTLTAGSDAIALLGGICEALNPSDSCSAAPDGSATELADLTGASRPPIWLGYQKIDPASGSYTMSCSVTHGGIERGYAGALASFTIPPTPPTPGMWVDWDGDGFGSTLVVTDHRLPRMLPEAAVDASQDDITADVKSVVIDKPGTYDHYGRSSPGQMTVIVKNEDGKYNPDNTASPLYGKLKPGLAVWFGSNDDGTLTTSGLTVSGRFGGYIREIVPTPVPSSPYEAQIICDDALARYGRARARVVFAANRTTAEYREAILTAIGETRTDLAAEPEVLPFSGTAGTRSRGVIVRGITDNSAADIATLAGLIAKSRTPPANALALLEELNSLSGMRHFIQPGATKEEWYKYTTVPRGWKLDSAEDASIDGAWTQSTSGYRITAESVVNLQEVEVRPTTTASAPATVWRHADVPFAVTNTSPVTVVADYGDYVFDAALSVASAGSTVYSTFIDFGDGAFIRLDSGGSSTVTALTVTGRPVIREPQQTVEATDDSSVTAYGETRGSTISSDLMQSPARAQALADFVIWKFAQPLKREQVNITNQLDALLGLRLYDVLTQTMVVLSIAGRRFEITGIHEEWRRAATAVIKEVRFSLDLQETPNQSALSFFRIGISGLGGTDGLAP